MSNALNIYNEQKTYYENYQDGPVLSSFAQSDHNTAIDYHTLGEQQKSATKKFKLWNYQLNSVIGIPAGPLLNSKFTEFAFQNGYDVCTYKTVRSLYRESNPMPNIVSLHPNEDFSPNDELLADNNFSGDLTITNSFGVPSFKPDIWQPDMAKALEKKAMGQILIGSFQGSKKENFSMIDDYLLTAKLVAETGVNIIEANLSCPNEGAGSLLCYNLPVVKEIVTKIKEALPDIKLLIKLPYFLDKELFKHLINDIASIIDGIALINSMMGSPKNINHEYALPLLNDNNKLAGVCGDAIFKGGLEMVTLLNKIKMEHDYKFEIIATGGVNSVARYNQYISNGANAVQSATGAMQDLYLAYKIKQQL